MVGRLQLVREASFEVAAEWAVELAHWLVGRLQLVRVASCAASAEWAVELAHKFSQRFLIRSQAKQWAHARVRARERLHARVLWFLASSNRKRLCVIFRSAPPTDQIAIRVCENHSR